MRALVLLAFSLAVNSVGGVPNARHYTQQTSSTDGIVSCVEYCAADGGMPMYRDSWRHFRRFAEVIWSTDTAELFGCASLGWCLNTVALQHRDFFPSAVVESYGNHLCSCRYAHFKHPSPLPHDGLFVATAALMPDMWWLHGRVGQLRVQFESHSSLVPLGVLLTTRVEYEANVAQESSVWVLGKASPLPPAMSQALSSSATVRMRVCAVYEDVLLADFSMKGFAPVHSLLDVAASANLTLAARPQPHAILPLNQCLLLDMQTTLDITFLCQLSRRIGTEGGLAYHQEHTQSWDQERQLFMPTWTWKRMHETYPNAGCVFAADLRRATAIRLHVDSNRLQRLTLTSDSAWGAVPDLSPLSQLTHLEVQADVFLDWTVMQRLSELRSLLLGDHVLLGYAHQLPSRLSDHMQYLQRVAWPRAYRIPMWGLPQVLQIQHSPLFHSYTHVWRVGEHDRECATTDISTLPHLPSDDIALLKYYDQHDLAVNALSRDRRKSLKSWCHENKAVDCSHATPGTQCIAVVCDDLGHIDTLTVTNPPFLPDLRLLPGIDLSLLDVSTNLVQEAPSSSLLTPCFLTGFTVSFSSGQGWPGVAEQLLECHTLRKLSFSNVDLSSVHAVGNVSRLFAFPLTELHLSNTGIHRLPQLPSSLRVLRFTHDALWSRAPLPSSLHTLEISYANLTEVPDDLPSTLRHLTLSHNSIESASGLSHMLEHIDLSGNRLTAAPNVWHYTNYLILDDNLLDRVPSSVRSMGGFISLRNNRFTGQIPLFDNATVRLQGNDWECDLAKLHKTDLQEYCAVTSDARVFDRYSHQWETAVKTTRASHTEHALLVKMDVHVLTNFSDDNPGCRYRLCPVHQYHCDSLFRPVSQPSVVSEDMFVFWERESCNNGSVLVANGLTAVQSTDCSGHVALPCSQSNTPDVNLPVNSSSPPTPLLLVSGVVDCAVEGLEVEFAAGGTLVSTATDADGWYQALVAPRVEYQVSVEGVALTTRGFSVDTALDLSVVSSVRLKPEMGTCGMEWPAGLSIPVRLTTRCGYSRVVDLTDSAAYAEISSVPSLWTHVQPVGVPIAGLHFPAQNITGSGAVLLYPASEFDIAFHEMADFNLATGQPVSGVFDWSPSNLVLDADTFYVASLTVQEKLCFQGLCRSCNATGTSTVSIPRWAMSGFEDVYPVDSIATLNTATSGVVTGHAHVMSFVWSPQPLLPVAEAADIGMRVVNSVGELVLHRITGAKAVSVFVTGTFATADAEDLCIDFRLPMLVPQLLLRDPPVSGFADVEWRDILSSTHVSVASGHHRVLSQRPTTNRVLAAWHDAGGFQHARERGLLQLPTVNRLAANARFDTLAATTGLIGTVAGLFGRVAGAGATSSLLNLGVKRLSTSEGYLPLPGSASDAVLMVDTSYRMCPAVAIGESGVQSSFNLHQTNVDIVETTRHHIEKTFLPQLQQLRQRLSDCSDASCNAEELWKDVDRQLLPGFRLDDQADGVHVQLADDTLAMWHEALQPVQRAKQPRCLFADDDTGYVDADGFSCVSSTAPSQTICSGHDRNLAADIRVQEGAIMRLPCSDSAGDELVYCNESGGLTRDSLACSNPRTILLGGRSSTVFASTGTYRRTYGMHWAVLRRSVENAGADMALLGVVDPGAMLQWTHSWHGRQRASVHAGSVNIHGTAQFTWRVDLITGDAFVDDIQGTAMCMVEGALQPYSEPQATEFLQGRWQDDVTVSLDGYREDHSFDENFVIEDATGNNQEERAIVWLSVPQHDFLRIDDHHYRPGSFTLFSLDHNDIPEPLPVEHVDMLVAPRCQQYGEWKDQRMIPWDAQPLQHLRLTIYRPSAVFVRRDQQELQQVHITQQAEDLSLQVGVAANVPGARVVVSAVIDSVLQPLALLRHSNTAWVDATTVVNITISHQELQRLDESTDNMLHFEMRGALCTPARVAASRRTRVRLVGQGDDDGYLWTEWSGATAVHGNVTFAMHGTTHTSNTHAVSGVDSGVVRVSKSTLLLWMSTLASNAMSWPVPLVATWRVAGVAVHIPMWLHESEARVAVRRTIVATTQGFDCVKRLVHQLSSTSAHINATADRKQHLEAVVSVFPSVHSAPFAAFQFVDRVLSDVEDCNGSQRVDVITDCTICATRVEHAPQHNPSPLHRLHRYLLDYSAAPRHIGRSTWTEPPTVWRPSVSVGEEATNWAYANSPSEAHQACLERSSCVAAVFQTRPWIFGGGIAHLYDHIPQVDLSDGEDTAMFLVPDPFDALPDTASACGDGCLLRRSHCHCSSVVGDSDVCLFKSLDDALLHCSRCSQCASLAAIGSTTDFVAYTSDASMPSAGRVLYKASPWVRFERDTLEWHVADDSASVAATFMLSTSGADADFSLADVQHDLSMNLCQWNMTLRGQHAQPNRWRVHLQAVYMPGTCDGAAQQDVQLVFWRLFEETSGRDWTDKPSATTDVCSWLRGSERGACTGGYLTELALGTNNLSLLSRSTANLHFPVTLQRLDLSRNRLVGAFPMALVLCRALKSADLSHNLFSGAIPDLVPLAQLTFLDLSFNRFANSLPRLPSSLQWVDVAYNGISGGLVSEPDDTTQQGYSTIPLFGGVELPRRKQLDDFHIMPFVVPRRPVQPTLHFWYRVRNGSWPQDEVLMVRTEWTTWQEIYPTATADWTPLTVTFPRLSPTSAITRVIMATFSPSVDVASVHNTQPNVTSPLLRWTSVPAQPVLNWNPRCFNEHFFSDASDTIDLAAEHCRGEFPNLSLFATRYLSLDDNALRFADDVLDLEFMPPELRLLRAPGVGLRGVLPNFRAGLPWLQQLLLSRNALQGQLVSHALPVNLTHLDVSYNRMDGTFPDLSGTQLQRLDVSGNDLRGPMPPAFLPTSLVFMSCSFNRFAGPPPSMAQQVDMRLDHNMWSCSSCGVLVCDAFYELGTPLPAADCVPATVTVSLSPIANLGPDFHAGRAYAVELGSSARVLVNGWQPAEKTVELSLPRSMFQPSVAVPVRVHTLPLDGEDEVLSRVHRVTVHTSSSVWTVEESDLATKYTGSLIPAMGVNRTFAPQQSWQVQASDHVQCEQQCVQHSTCRGWVFSRLDQGCALFNATPVTSDAASTVFGRVPHPEQMPSPNHCQDWCYKEGVWPDTIDGQWAEVSCEAGLQGTVRRGCNSTGWTEVVRQCRVASCTADGNWPETLFGESATRSCGWLEHGHVTRTCGAQGWGEEQRHCTRVQCPHDGQWMSTEAGQIQTLPCTDSTQSGNVTRVCGLGWEVPEDNCRTVQCQADGTFPATPAGEVALVPCPRNATHAGLMTRECSYNGWQAQVDVCRRVSCETQDWLPSAPLHETVFGSCEDKTGVVTRGGVFAECKPHGWDITDTCRYECGWDSVFPNNVPVPSTITMQCPENKKGNLTRVCSDHGWEAVEGHCELVYCMATGGFPATAVGGTTGYVYSPDGVASCRRCGTQGWENVDCSPTDAPTDTSTDGSTDTPSYDTTYTVSTQAATDMPTGTHSPTSLNFNAATSHENVAYFATMLMLVMIFM